MRLLSIFSLKSFLALLLLAGGMFVASSGTAQAQSVAQPLQAAICRPTLSPDRTNTDARQKTLSFQVLLPPGCDWKVADWSSSFIAPITLTGHGHGVIRFSVAQNAKRTGRNGFIRVYGYYRGVKQNSDVFHITQAGM